MNTRTELLVLLFFLSVACTVRCETSFLLYGGSLTEGNSFNCNHPYAYELSRLSGCAVTYSGHSGAGAAFLLDNLPALLEHMKPRNYTAAVVLVGTNDLHQALEGTLTMHQLAQRIEEIHTKIHNATGVQTFVLGIPAPWQDAFEPRQRIERQALNEWLADFCAKNVGKHTFVDTLKLLPRTGQPQAVETHRFVEVHFTPHGYNELAGVVGDALMAADVPMCPLFGPTGTSVPLRVTSLNPLLQPLCYP